MILQCRTIAILMLITSVTLPYSSEANAKTEWVQIGQGPNFEYAKAYCDNASMGVGQGYWAYGSQAYVAGVALAYGIGNLIQQSKYFHNCMAMQGWKKVNVSKSANKASGKKSTITAPSNRTVKAYQAPQQSKLSAGCANAKTMDEMQKYCQ